MRENQVSVAFVYFDIFTGTDKHAAWLRAVAPWLDTGRSRYGDQRRDLSWSGRHTSVSIGGGVRELGPVSTRVRVPIRCARCLLVIKRLGRLWRVLLIPCIRVRLVAARGVVSRCRVWVAVRVCWLLHLLGWIRRASLMPTACIVVAVGRSRWSGLRLSLKLRTSRKAMKAAGRVSRHVASLHRCDEMRDRRKVTVSNFWTT